MTRRFTLKRSEVALAALLLSTVCMPRAFAQGPGGPPPGGPPPFGGPGGPGGRGFFGGGPNGEISVAQAPINALAAGLKLTSDQKTRIAKIQQDAQAQRRALFPRPGQGQDGPGNGPGDGPGGPPDPEQMRAAMDKMRGMDEQVKSNIEAVLTDEQKQALPGFLKEIQAFRAAGISPEVYGSLKLTGSQKQKLIALGKQAQETTRQAMDKARESGDFESVREAMDQSRRQTHDKAMAILTSEQRATVQKYQQAHPRPAGGPPEGGPGGPPPGGPDGGPDGPPPGGPDGSPR
jgi:hypothetical protein